MLTLSTHDTKRSGDVRARLNVLSELPGPGRTRWGDGREINDRYRQGRGRIATRSTCSIRHWSGPGRSIRRGPWPLWPRRPRRPRCTPAGLTRWPTTTRPCEVFVGSLLADRGLRHPTCGSSWPTSGLWSAGRRNSLAQTTLALTCPGVPDIYQGSELWDLSLVDPDNRRPVDYTLRRRLLAGMREDRLDRRLPTDRGAATRSCGSFTACSSIAVDDRRSTQSTELRAACLFGRPRRRHGRFRAAAAWPWWRPASATTAGTIPRSSYRPGDGRMC